MPKRLLLPFVVPMAFALCQPVHADDEAPSYVLGAGVQRMPSWEGSKDHRNQSLPYLDIEIPGLGALSTADGLTIDLLHDEHWHGGFYGNYLWGRTSDGLGALHGKIRPLSPRLQAGGYVEYAFDKNWSVGSHVSHDTNGAGAYLSLYLDWQLPSIGYIEHSLELQHDSMNGAAMNRFFGISPAEAAALGSSPYHPGAGAEMASIEYDAFIPTSQHTGIALAIDYGRIFGHAADSVLVRHYGSRTQFSQTLAFVYRF